MLDVVDVLQRLIRFDTTNPPGNERTAVTYVQDLIESAGVATTLLAKDPDRPNLVARVSGRGEAPPLLLQGHIDVVPTTDQQWAHDPFGGELIDGYVWGRGALDMKSGVVMMVDAFLRAAAGETPPAGDVILCVVADEEDGGAFGAKFLVEEHPDLFTDVRYGIGEFGAFPLFLAGKKFYPIQIAERIGVRFTLTMRGPAGHGSLPVTGGAMAKLGRTLTRLDRRRFPIHVTPATRLMLEA
ncbi:MAG: M20/M25/M40 family metallo-hydrolase, partial [Acidimicrobiia bacterium]|nr:M20/M25/M40 family metallo-hydrolase [Acidimicrobiia bacterium]